MRRRVSSSMNRKERRACSSAMGPIQYLQSKDKVAGAGTMLVERPLDSAATVLFSMFADFNLIATRAFTDDFAILVIPGWLPLCTRTVHFFGGKGHRASRHFVLISLGFHAAEIRVGRG